jgi:hypothetical protein
MTRRATPQPGVDRMVSTSWSGRRWSSPAARQGRALARGLEGRLPLQHHHVRDQNSSRRRVYFSLALKHGIYRDRTDGLCSAIAALSQPPDVRASAALEIICEDYADTQITVTLDSMVDIVAVYMSSLDADQGVKFRDAVNAGVTPVAAP